MKGDSFKVLNNKFRMENMEIIITLDESLLKQLCIDIRVELSQRKRNMSHMFWLDLEQQLKRKMRND